MFEVGIETHVQLDFIRFFGAMKKSGLPSFIKTLVKILVDCSKH